MRNTVWHRVRVFQIGLFDNLLKEVERSLKKCSRNILSTYCQLNYPILGNQFGHLQTVLVTGILPDASNTAGLIDGIH